MSNGILSKLINEIGEANAEARSESYTMVNVRPGEKVSAMLDLLAKLSGKSPSALVSDELSKRLAKRVASNPAYADTILKAVEMSLAERESSGFQENSALDYLQKQGVIEVKDPITTRAASQVADLFASSKKNQTP